ncbi:hypothetical protein C7443_1146 [Plasticicumulans acidivorans]|uniref:Uncharacterized protein n=1 Tax=Plasticicumulans acidivorans TaxID=886464 RepID=A0A317MQ29_9GAMM|nr:hypothetical protein C7443_1146 [Plasticicumulans acidivorans]
MAAVDRLKTDNRCSTESRWSEPKSSKHANQHGGKTNYDFIF